MKKIGIRILGCMALLSMVGCGRIEGASVQDLSNTKDAIVESETTLQQAFIIMDRKQCRREKDRRISLVYALLQIEVGIHTVKLQLEAPVLLML